MERSPWPVRLPRRIPGESPMILQLQPMKTTCCIVVVFVLSLVARTVSAADEVMDQKKLRQLHERLKSGAQLTPEEQAYYDRGKAERQRRGRASSPATVTPAVKSSSS